MVCPVQEQHMYVMWVVTEVFMASQLLHPWLQTHRFNTYRCYKLLWAVISKVGKETKCFTVTKTASLPSVLASGRLSLWAPFYWSKIYWHISYRPCSRKGFQLILTIKRDHIVTTCDSPKLPKQPGRAWIHSTWWCQLKTGLMVGLGWAIGGLSYDLL